MRILCARLTLLAGVSCAAGTPAGWTLPDTVLEITAEAGLASEWAQMVAPIPGNGCKTITGMDGELFGHNPSRAELNRYFAAWMIAHPVISWQLPQPWRMGFQCATIGFELAVNRHNASVGCRIQF